MIYRKYFGDNDTKGQRQFFDSIVGQVSKRTIGTDGERLFVEYETKEIQPSNLTPSYGNFNLTFSDKGYLCSTFALPLAVAAGMVK